MKKNKTAGERRGFALVEVLVVVLLIGIVAGLAVPGYNKSVENSKADLAVANVKAIGDANRRYFLNNGAYTYGIINNAGPNSCVIWTCKSDACVNNPKDPNCTNPCNLLRCNYLSDQDWSTHPYYAASADPNNSTSIQCTIPGGTGPNIAACTRRRDTSFLGGTGTDIKPYTNWAYTVDMNGNVQAYNGAPLSN